MKKIGLTFIIFTALATFGVQAQGDGTVETWRCFDPHDSDKNTVLVELTRGAELRSLTTEEAVEFLKALFKAEGVTPKRPIEDLKPVIEVLVESITTEEAVENLKALVKAEGMTPKGPIEDLKPVIEDLVDSINATAPGQISVAGVTHFAFFYIEGLNRRWDFGKEMNYSFIIEPDGWGVYYDFRLAEDDGRTKARQVFKCVSSRSLPPAELPQWDGPQRQPRREKDPQKRPGRKRTANGWVYELE